VLNLAGSTSSVDSMKEHRDTRVTVEVTEKKAVQVGMKEQAANHSIDDFSLEKYLDEMTELVAAAQKKASYEREMSDKKATTTDEVAHSREVMTQEEVEDEATIKARFEDWMKEYGPRYKKRRRRLGV
jgi:chemotaxis regulatin CheY-phosphate phosphatase CheZ